METFWAMHNLVPSLGPAPAAWPDRLGSGVTFWCFNKFRLGLRAAQSSTDRVNKALDLMRKVPGGSPAEPVRSDAAPAAAAGPDPLQDVDWSLPVHG